MEHTADYAADIARHIALLCVSQQRIPDDVLKLMIDAGTNIVNLYMKAVSAFFSKDIIRYVEITKQQQRIEKLEIEIAPKAFTGEPKSAELVVRSAIYATRRESHIVLQI